MERNVTITVLGEQFYEDMEPDRTELLTEGTLERTENGWRLRYEESELTGMEGTSTLIEVEGETMTLRRVGAVQAEMRFCRGEISTSAYETPYGALTVEIGTSLLRTELDESGGELELRYSIAVAHQVTGENRLLIKIK